MAAVMSMVTQLSKPSLSSLEIFMNANWGAKLHEVTKVHENKGVMNAKTSTGIL